jgi:hypothetical protein
LAAEAPRQQQNAQRARGDAIEARDKWTRKRLLRRESCARRKICRSPERDVIGNAQPAAADLSIRT